jgi:hypothetical protein
MNPYLFTVTFLMMMSFLTSSEAIRFAQSTLENKCYLDSRDCFVAIEEVRELSHLQELRGLENDTPKHKPTSPKKSKPYTKKARALGVNAARPPNNSRLNIHTLLHKAPNKQLPKEFSLYEVCAKVMRALYKDESFFCEISDAEYHILDKLIEKKQETLHFTTPDQLGSVHFDDEALQKIFYHMLKGTKNAPSLLNYLTFDPIDTGQARKINLLFADPLIIKAIFPEGETAKKILARRDKIWEEIAYQEEHRLELVQAEGKGRQAFWDEIKKALEEVLASAGLKAEHYKSQVFDCTVGKPGSVIFLEDPHTGHLTREKYTPAA